MVVPIDMIHLLQLIFPSLEAHLKVMIIKDMIEAEVEVIVMIEEEKVEVDQEVDTVIVINQKIYQPHNLVVMAVMDLVINPLQIHI